MTFGCTLRALIGRQFGGEYFEENKTCLTSTFFSLLVSWSPLKKKFFKRKLLLCEGMNE